MRSLNTMAKNILQLEDEYFARPIVMEVTHAALQTEAMLVEQEEINRDTVEVINRLYGQVAIVLGQLQIGNIAGANEILAAILNTRGHNAQIEGA